MHDFRQPRWDKKWHARAKEMEESGMNREEIAKQITVESGRNVYRKSIFRWLGPIIPAWQDRWIGRAIVLYKEGMTRFRIAAIITEESGRNCYHSTVREWLIREGVLALEPRKRVKPTGHRA